MQSLTFQPLHRLSPDEMLAFCQLNTELRCEMNPNGSITLKKPYTRRYKKLIQDLLRDLQNWNEQVQIGVVFDDHIGFILSNGAIRMPALSMVRPFKANAQNEHLIEFAPDFVLEFLTESETLAVVQLKMKEYMATGCNLAWLIDVQNENVHIYRANDTVQLIHGFGQAIVGTDILQGFSFKI
jgi:Uma2 family endonuclease